MKTIDLLKEGTLLPPSPDKCQQCAVEHHPDQAHSKDSMFYQYWFRKQHDRWPTWKDAIEHCPPKIKEFWERELEVRGISLI